MLHVGYHFMYRYLVCHHTGPRSHGTDIDDEYLSCLALRRRRLEPTPMSGHFQLYITLCIVSILSAPFLFFVGRKREHPNAPPVVPAKFPWVGDIFPFVLSRADLLVRYRSVYQCRSVITIAQFWLANDRSKHGPIYKFLAAGRYIVVVSSPVLVTNALNMPGRISTPLAKEGLSRLSGITERLTDLVELVHWSAAGSIAIGLSGRNLADVTVPLNKHIFSYLGKLADSAAKQPQTMSLVDYVVPALYGASVAALFGKTCVPNTAADFAHMDDGMFYLLNCVPFVARSSERARMRMINAAKPYIRNAWEGTGSLADTASSVVSSLLIELRDAGISVEDSSRLLIFLIWGSHSTLLETALAALSHLLADPDTYDSIAKQLRSVINLKYPDIQDLLRSEPQDLNEPQFAILDSIVQETLRLNAVSSSIRLVLQDTILRGDGNATYHLNKGELVVIDVRGMHYDETLFPQPRRFIPDRFLGKNAYVGKNGVNQIRPFGGGKYLVSDSLKIQIPSLTASKPVQGS